MKSFFACLLISMIAGPALAQYGDRQVPGNVSQSFQRQYPDAHNAQWNQQNRQWHARFNDQGPQDRGEMVAHYDDRGRPIDSHIRYDEHDVPGPVMHWAHRRYHRGHDYEFTRIERPRNAPLFQVSVNLGSKRQVSYVDEQGRDAHYYDRH